jgi:hypothetical protein
LTCESKVNRNSGDDMAGYVRFVRR